MAKINAINNESAELTIDPGASGDSFIQFDINTTGEFRIGVDDTDDSFRISQGSALGTNDTFIMTDAGECTLPLQPAVLVTLDGTDSNKTGDGTTWTCQLDSEIYDQNNDFDTGTYTFTAPVTGRYMVIGSMQPQDQNSNHNNAVLEIVTSNRTYLLNQVDSYVIARNTASEPLCIKGNCFADMDASDTLTFELTISGGTKVIDIVGSSTRTKLNVYLVC